MIYEFNGYVPVIDESSFIHELAAVTGNVIIGKVDADSATGDRQLKIAGYGAAAKGITMLSYGKIGTGE